jgi:hypothetical protein
MKLLSPKHRVLFTFAIVMILGGLAWLVLHTKPEPANPAYKGKRLSEWIAVYDPANTNRARQLMQETQDAIRQMGTNSIPYLLRMLEHSDSPLKVKWMRLLQKQSLVKVEYIPEMNRYERAAMALEVLGPRAKDAVPELVRIFDQNPSANAKMSIGRVLGLMGPYAKAAVPSLLREAAGTNALARARANPCQSGRSGAGACQSRPAGSRPHDPDIGDVGLAVIRSGRQGSCSGTGQVLGNTSSPAPDDRHLFRPQ